MLQRLVPYPGLFGIRMIGGSRDEDILALFHHENSAGITEGSGSQLRRLLQHRGQFEGGVEQLAGFIGCSFVSIRGYLVHDSV
jgi:hypothetical protein